jgi:hypothetical protein
LRKFSRTSSSFFINVLVDETGEVAAVSSDVTFDAVLFFLLLFLTGDLDRDRSFFFLDTGDLDRDPSFFLGSSVVSSSSVDRDLRSLPLTGDLDRERLFLVVSFSDLSEDDDDFLDFFFLEEDVTSVVVLAIDSFLLEDFSFFSFLLWD